MADVTSRPTNTNQSELDLLAEEFADRYRRGERPAISEYTSRYPELAEEIADLFPALAMIEQVDDDLRHVEEQTPSAKPVPPIKQLGDFRIIREVGQGGMGVVYEAEQVSLGRRVALKLLPQQQFAGEKQRKRFEREAKAAARLHHTNIVPVFGVGEQDGLHYYVMQFIDGLGLDDVVTELRQLREQQAAGPGTTQPHTPARENGERKTAPVPAASVAHSLLTGQFDRTVLLADKSDSSDAEGNPVSSGNRVSDTLNSQSSTLNTQDTAVGQLSDTATGSGHLALPGSVTDSSDTSQEVYWESVARIGVQAAQGLQYAHEQGIIHRDVKPANLLLDTRGCVWVTDFGLAKADDQENLTHTGDVLGTLRYMAPEQFDGQADARSDLYSLGLTLYEMLALKPGFNETDRHKLIKQVTTGTPPRLRTLDPHIPRDLETIVHKAIDRDPSHRYTTAGELAADLQRYLGDEPIRARWISPPKRFLRWCRRNPMGTTVLILLLVLAVGGPLAAANQLQLRSEADNSAAEAAVQQAEAARQRRIAEENLRQARAAVDRLFTKSANELRGTPHMEEIRRELLEDALEFYQGFLQQKSDDPVIRQETALAYSRVGGIHDMLGRPDEAIEPQRGAIRLFEALHSEFPANVEYESSLAEATSRLAGHLREAGHSEESITVGARALTKWDDLVRRFPTVVEYRRHLARKHVAQANQLNTANRLADAESHCRKSLEMWEQFRGDFPHIAPQVLEEAQTHHWLGSTLLKAGRVNEAVFHLREAIRLRIELAEDHPNNLRLRASIGHAQLYLGSALLRQAELEEAEVNFRSAIEIHQPITADFPRNARYRRRLIWGRRDLALTLFSQRRFHEAGIAQRQVLALQRETEPQDDSTETSLAWEEYNLGLIVHHQGRIEEAATMFREAFNHFEQLFAEADDDPALQTRLRKALSWTRLTCPLQQFRNPKRAMTLTNLLLQEQPLSADWWGMLGIAHYRLRNWDDAIEALQQSLDLAQGGTSAQFYFLAMAHHRRGERDAALQWYQTALNNKQNPEALKTPDLLNFKRETEELLGIEPDTYGADTNTDHDEANSLIAPDNSADTSEQDGDQRLPTPPPSPERASDNEQPRRSDSP